MVKIGKMFEASDEEGFQLHVSFQCREIKWIAWIACETSNISRIKSQYFNDSRLVL